MEEKDRENIALFRFGLISPLVNGQVKSKKDYMDQVCSQAHQVPYWGPKEYRPDTIEEWVRLYQGHGFDGLKPLPAWPPWNPACRGPCTWSTPG